MLKQIFSDVVIAYKLNFSCVMGIVIVILIDIEMRIIMLLNDVT